VILRPGFTLGGEGGGAAHTPEELERRLAQQEALMDALLADDVRTLTGIRFKVGTLLKEDRAMARFLRWVHAFPTADPAAPYA